MLTVDELREGFQVYLGDQILFEEELLKIVKNIDLNGNGQIEISEFITVCANMNKLMTEKNLREAFDLFDIDANGEITPREIKHILDNE